MSRTPPKIITTHVSPPIPVRFCDWQAHYDGEEDEQMATGSGATEQEAVDDLLTNHPRSGNPCPNCKKPATLGPRSRRSSVGSGPDKGRHK